MIKRYSDIAYLGLREAILLRRREPGETLTASDEACRLDCKVSAVTAAFRLLAAEGYMELGARAKGRVRSWSANDLRDAFEMRQQILEFAVTEAARQRNPLTNARLKSIVTVLESIHTAEATYDEIVDCIGLFEIELCNGAGIEGLSTTLRNVFPLLLVHISALVSDDVSLRRRCRSYRNAISLVEEQDVNAPDDAFAIDAIDQQVVEYLARGTRAKPLNTGSQIRPTNRENTYARWSGDRQRLAAGHLS